MYDNRMEVAPFVVTAAPATAAAPTAAAAPSATAAAATATEAATPARRSTRRSRSQSRSAQCSLFELEEANAKAEHETEKEIRAKLKNSRHRSITTTNIDPKTIAPTTTLSAANKWKSAMSLLSARNATKGGAADIAAAAIDNAKYNKKENSYYDDALNILCSPAPKLIKEQQQLLSTWREPATLASLSPSVSPNQGCNQRVSLPNISGATRDSIPAVSTPLGEMRTTVPGRLPRFTVPAADGGGVDLDLSGIVHRALVGSPSSPALPSESQPLSPTEMRQPVPPRGERAAGAGRRIRRSSV